MVQSSPQSVPERPFQVAVVGSYLGRARFGAALLNLPSIKVVGIVDTDSRSARGWARELPGKPAVYDSTSTLLAAQPNLDGVLVTTARGDRGAAIEVCVAAGIPVLTEFPYTRSLAEMDLLARIAAERGAISTGAEGPQGPIQITAAFTHQHEPALIELERAILQGSAGPISRVRCEVSFPLGAGYALENGVVPISIDWYDLLQVVACRSLDLCRRWLGEAVSINADIDLPHHSAIAGRRAADPVANLIVANERGQSTHLLKLSRSVHPSERYLLTGTLGSLELIRCTGEKAALGPSVSIQLNGQRPQRLYSAPDTIDVAAQAAAAVLLEFAGAARSRDPVANSIPESRAVLEAVQAAFVSAREGIRIPLPLHNSPDIDSILEAG